MSIILLDPGIISFAPLKENIIKYLENNRLVIINDKPHKNGWREISNLCDFVSYDFLLNIDSDQVHYDIKCNYSKLLNNIIDDHRTFLIYERVKRLFFWDSIFTGIQNIEIQIYNSIKLLERYKPDQLIFQATPHNIHSWLLAKTAEYLGFKVNMIQTSPLPWKYWIVEGLDTQTPIYPNLNISISKDDDLLLRHFSKINTSDYDTAIPSYEKSRIEDRGGRYWSWKKELLDIIKRPKKLLTVFHKRKLYTVYNSLTSQVDFEKKYLIFFLHYQPERTSLPEAGFYSQQWLIIKQISMVLPENWLLYVKEHPSTFTGNYNVKYRNPDFYKKITSLSNVRLLDLSSNTFDLIDHAQLIVTITGTVGVQSLMRNKPVMVFGVASYRNAFGVIKVSDIYDIEEAINCVETYQDANVFKIKTEEYLNKINSISIGNSNYIVEHGLDIYEKNVRCLGHLCLLNNYFSSFIKLETKNKSE